MSTTIQNWRAAFLTNSQRLIAATGDLVPPWSAAMQDAADHALNGDIYRDPNGVYTRIDPDQIDWTCAKSVNPETMQMHLLRFHILVPLASVYRKTGDERYALMARRLIETFLRDFPTVENWRPVKYDGPTQFDVRVGCSDSAGWMGTIHAFLASPAFDDAFFEKVIAAVRAHLKYLTSHIYPDRNIRFMNGDVLVINGVRLAFLPDAQAWRTQGVRIVNDAVRRQILVDGAHMEAVPGYHDGIMYLATSQWRLARAMPDLGLEVPTERIARMYDYSLAATRPDGFTISTHDTRYTPAHQPGGVQLGEARRQFRTEAGLPLDTPPVVQHFPVAGQTYLRSSWEAGATYVTFDATTRLSYHWHPCRNGITLYANGRPLLVDTGYPFATAEFPRYGHRTAHHSTLNLNGWDQSHTDARLRVRSAPGYDVVDGLYSGGYWPIENHSHNPGIFGEHHRTLLWIHGRCLVIIDNLRTSSESWRKPTVENIWQFSEGPLEVDAAKRQAVTRHADSNLLMQFALMPAGTTIAKHEGERQPMRGWVPIDWGRLCVPAPMVRLATQSHDPWQADHVTVLVPFKGTDAPALVSSAVGPDQAFGDRSAGRLDLRWADGTVDRLVWIRRMENAIDRQHGFDTDSALAHIQLSPAGKLVGGIAVDGRYLLCDEFGSSDQIANVSKC